MIVKGKYYDEKENKNELKTVTKAVYKTLDINDITEKKPVDASVFTINNLEKNDLSKMEVTPTHSPLSSEILSKIQNARPVDNDITLDELFNLKSNK